MSLSRAVIMGICILLGACASQTHERNDSMPMYGYPDQQGPAVLTKADQDFIAKAIAEQGSRETASQIWYNKGDTLLEANDLDLALRHYNQAWLLNPVNYQPYWGFARVMVARRQFDEAFRYFDKALVLINDDYQQPALLSDYAIALHNQANATPRRGDAQSRKYFALANDMFKRSVEADPSYVNGWFKWAFSLYVQRDYAQAWQKVKQALERESNAVPESFLQDLRTAMPEPDA